MRIGLIFGGNTSEGEVSQWSAKGVRRALHSLKYEVIDIEFNSKVAEKIINTKPEVIFNCMHGEYGEDGRLQAMLDIMQIPYTHSGMKASMLGLDKNIQKQLLSLNDIPVIYGVTIGRDKLRNIKNIIKNDQILNNNKELVLKPNQDGSSRGVVMIKNIDIFDVDTYLAEQQDTHFLLEERIYGRELNVAVFQGKAIDIIEIIPTKADFYDFESKYTDGGSVHKFVEDISLDLRNKILTYAEKINNIIGATDISRVEFILTPEDKIYTLELNSHPGFTPTSSMPETLAKHNISYEMVVDTLIKNAKYNK